MRKSISFRTAEVRTILERSGLNASQIDEVLPDALGKFNEHGITATELFVQRKRKKPSETPSR